MYHFFKPLFSCNVTLLPVATLVHSFMKEGRSNTRFTRCLNKAKLTQAGQRCMNNSPLRELCARNISNDCFTNLTLAKRCVKDNITLEQCSVQMNPTLEPFLQHQQCFIALKPRLKSCLSMLKFSCERSRIRSAKVNRLTTETLDTLIREMPDIHIIYYTRDPRGIIASRITTGDPPKFFLSAKSPIAESELLCQKMLRDLTFIKSYETRYPGSVMRLTYEDLAAHPVMSAQKVYSYIGEDAPEFVLRYLELATNARHQSSAFGTTRTNSTATSMKWKDILSLEQMRNIDNTCEDLYKELYFPSDKKATPPLN